MNPSNSISVSDLWEKLLQVGVYVIAFFLALGVKDLKKSFDAVPRLRELMDQVREEQKDHENRIRDLERK
jgi:hypothetical protein